MTEQPYMQEPWFRLLKEACEFRGVMAVAADLGWKNHSGTSRILNGTYGDHTRFAKRVMQRLGTIRCQHTGRHVLYSYCIELSSGPPPTHSPPRLTHWLACQKCPNKPTGYPGEEK
jgi:hypothetical protein